MIIEAVCAGVALFAAVRAVLEKRTLKKLAYLNILNFAAAGAVVLLLPYPITIAAAVAYFVGATLESNAIASVYGKTGGKE